MFTNLLKTVFAHKNKRAACGSRKPKTPRMQVEFLEERALLSANPFPYPQGLVDDSGQPAGHSMAAAQTVNLMPMMQSQVRNAQTSAGVDDYFKVQLRQGEIFAANDQASSRILNRPIPASPALDFLDATGHVLAHADASANPSLACRVPADGTYYLRASTPRSILSASNSINLLPVRLNSNMADTGLLQQVNTYTAKNGGAVEVWLDGTMLDFAGPAGQGFQVRGIWQENGTGHGAAFTATGTTYLETALGEIPMNTLVPFTVTTKPGPGGLLFGDLDQINLAPLNDLTTTFSAKLPIGIKAKLPQASWGVKLGNDLVNGPVGTAPLNAAFPYLYASISATNNTTFSFGGITLTVPVTPVKGPSFNVVADPADPFVYVSENGLKPLPGLAVAYSQHGLIPFTPNKNSTPSHYTGNITGNVFLGLKGLSLTDAGVPLPLSLDGDLTINVDPNHTGKFLGGAFSNVSDFVAAIDQGPAPLGADLLQRLGTAFQNITVGFNGTVSFGVDLKQLFNIDAKVFDLKVTGVQETAIWDGPAEKLYLDGAVPSPLVNTKLNQFLSGTVGEDVYISLKDRQYDFQLAGQANLLGSKGGLQASASVEATNIKTTPGGAGIHVDVQASLLGSHAELKGNVQSNGDLSLSGSANLNLFHLVNASADFSLVEQGGSVTVSAHLHAGIQVFNVFRGSLDATLYLNWDNTQHHLTFSGSGSAQLQVNVPVWGWVTLVGLSVGVSNDQIAISGTVLGFTETLTITLPF
jgi:hypothetical protein